MAFFDTIGKRISDAGQNVAQQTKNLADITQLNSSISEKQKNIHQLYLCLGQAYYKSHKDDSSADEHETIVQINTLFSEIEQCHCKIEQIRNSKAEKTNTGIDSPDTHICPKCGATISEDNLFCTQCGNKL